jgi:hypothetical protein
MWVLCGCFLFKRVFVFRIFKNTEGGGGVNQYRVISKNLTFKNYININH